MKKREQQNKGAFILKYMLAPSIGGGGRFHAKPACFYIIFLVTKKLAFESSLYLYFYVLTQPAFTCSKLTIETLEQGVKYVQS